MRKLIVFTAACIFVCSLFLMVQPASAALALPQGDSNTAWETTANNTNSFTIDYTYGVSNFGIFEIGTDDHVNLGSVVTKIAFSNTGEVLKDDQPTGVSFESLQWGFYEGTWGSSPDFNYDYKGSSDNWTLAFYKTENELGVVNANPVPNNDPPSPVPIPTAVLLFGSGLIGLAGFKRRSRQSKS